MTRAAWILGLLLLTTGTAQAQQCPPPGGALNPGLIFDVHAVPAAGGMPSALPGATVCLTEVTGEPGFGTLAFNISLLEPRTTGTTGYACFDFGPPSRAVGLLRGDFRGTITVRAQKDGYCADEKTIDFQGQVHQHLRPREIPSNSNERVWCGSKAGLRCIGTGPSPFRDPLPQASPELLHQAPSAMPALEAPTPGTPAPMDMTPRDSLTRQPGMR